MMIPDINKQLRWLNFTYARVSERTYVILDDGELVTDVQCYIFIFLLMHKIKFQTIYCEGFVMCVKNNVLKG